MSQITPPKTEVGPDMDLGYHDYGFTYQNETDKTLILSTSFESSLSFGHRTRLYIDASSGNMNVSAEFWSQTNDKQGSDKTAGHITAIIPPGYYYKFDDMGKNQNIGDVQGVYLG